jgi:glycosyltransferase involved in cell wall biosynthesis
MLLRHGLGKEVIVYTYDRIVAPGLLAKLSGRSWVVDVRTPPLEQDAEFAALAAQQKPGSRAPGRFRKWLLKSLYRRSDLVVTLSEDLKRFLIDEYGLPEHKIYVLPMGVELTRFTCPRDPPPCVPFRLIYVGSFALRERGVGTALEAVARLKAEGIPIQMVIAGEPGFGSENSVMAAISRLNLHKDVDLRGPVPHQAIPALLSEAHVGLSPMHNILSFRVSSPAKVVEYLAAGKPVVASDLPAHRRLIRDGWNGLLFEPGNPRDLAVKLRSLVEDRSFYFELAGHARESVSALDWNALLPGLFDRMRNLAGP